MAAVIEPTLRFHESGIVGAGPGLFYGTDAPNGDAAPWSLAPVGTRYVRKLSAGGFIEFQKCSNKQLDGDWRPISGAVMQTVSYADFTDGGAAVGTLVLDDGIPVGATVKRSFAGADGFHRQCGLHPDDWRRHRSRPLQHRHALDFTTAAGETDMGAISGTAPHRSQERHADRN